MIVGITGGIASGKTYCSSILERIGLSQSIFSNKEMLQQMNQIVHPAVRNDFMNWAQKELKSNSYILQESALLVETGSYKIMDKLIVVDAPKEERIKRVIRRDGSTKEEVVKRMENQLSSVEKRKVAHYIVDNHKDDNIIQKLMMIHFDIMKAAR